MSYGQVKYINTETPNFFIYSICISGLMDPEDMSNLGFADLDKKEKAKSTD